VADFLKERDDFEVDRSREKFLFTFIPAAGSASSASRAVAGKRKGRGGSAALLWRRRDD
jgi:hypothetical protein